MKKFFYRVTDGDTVSILSEKFVVPTCKLIELNNLEREVEEGDILYVEINDERRYKTYKVDVRDTLNSIAKKFNTTEEKILLDNNLPYIFYGLIILV